MATTSLADELLKANQELAQARQTIEALRRSSQFPEENPNPVLRIAAAGDLVYANPPARDWLLTLGWQAGGLPPAPVLTLADEARRQGHAIESEIGNQAGTTFWFSAAQPPGEDHVNLYGSDITDRKRAEDERETTVTLLKLANDSTTVAELVRAAVEFFQSKSGCEAVGIRLRREHDYPYYETRGFPPEFVLLENSLCARDDEGRPILDCTGSPVLDCMCGNVICGRFDPSRPFFTARGSFWTNDTTRLLATSTEADRQARTRNRCNGEGYESVALIPLQVGGERLGLLQLNDRRPGCFTPEGIAMWERLADHLAVALARFLAEDQRQAVLDERGRLLDEVRRQFAFLEQLIAELPAGVAVVSGSEYRYELANPIYQAIPGTPGVPMLGRRLADVFPEIAAQAALARLDQVYRTGQTVSVREYETTIGPGHPVTYWNVTIVPLFDSAGNVERVLILTQDVTEGVRARRVIEELAGQAQQQAAELDAILESMVEAVVVYDYADNPVQANHAAREAYGVALAGPSRSEIIDLMGLRHLDGRCVALGESPVDRALRGQIVQGDRYLFAHAARGDRIMAASASPVRQADRALGAVIVWHDITNQVRAEEQREAALQVLERRNQELQALTEELEAYDHTVAHDLKNPLFRVIGMADLLAEALEDVEDEGPRTMLRGILDGSLRMREIVDSLLLLSSSRSQQVAIGPLDMGEIVAQARQELVSLVEQGRARIAVPEEWPLAHGYAPWVRSVWVNYLSNALKYGGQSPHIELGATVEPHVGQARGQEMVRFWVRDHGLGLTDEQRALLFVPFNRLDRPKELGHGLGLAIVRRIVDRLGGQVGVESLPGAQHGCTFWFTLPAPPANQP